MQTSQYPPQSTPCQHRTLTKNEHHTPPLTLHPTRHPQHLISITTQAPPPMRRPLHHTTPQMHQLIHQKIQHEQRLVVRPHPHLFIPLPNLKLPPAIVRLRTTHRRQRRAQYIHQLPHVPFRLPPLAVHRQQSMSIPTPLVQVRQQPEMIRKPLPLPLQHHQHHSTPLLPTPRPVLMLVTPSPRLPRRTPRRTRQIRPRHPVQHRIALQPRHIPHPSLLQPPQQPRLRKPSSSGLVPS